MSADLVWHDDGHVLVLELVRADLRVLQVECPGGECASDEGCVVSWFAHRYGLECNVGQCAPEAQMRVAWALVGDRRDLDAAQVWVIPTADPVFSAWSAAQGSSTDLQH